MSINKLLFMLLVIVIAALGAVGYLANQAFDEINQNSTKAIAQTTEYSQVINGARQAQVNFQRQVQEWKNILIRGNNADLFTKYSKAFNDKEADVQKNLSETVALVSASSVIEPRFAQLLTELKNNHAAMGSTYREALATFDPEDPETGKKVDGKLQGVDRATSKGMDELSAALKVSEAAKINEIQQQNQQLFEQVKKQGMIIFAAVIAFLIFVVLSISYTISGSIGGNPKQLKDVLNALAEGDFTKTVESNKPKSLAGSAAKMQTNVRAMLRQLTNQKDELNALSSAVESTTDVVQVRAAFNKARITIREIEKAVNKFKLD